MGCDGVANSGYAIDKCGQCRHQINDTSFDNCTTNDSDVEPILDCWDGMNSPLDRLWPLCYDNVDFFSTEVIMEDQGKRSFVAYFSFNNKKDKSASIPIGCRGNWDSSCNKFLHVYPNGTEVQSNTPYNILLFR